MYDREDLIAPLVEAVTVALREMGGVESGLRDTTTDAITGPGLLAAVLPVNTVAGSGYLVLSLPEATAAELARRVLLVGEAAADPTAAVVRDCAGEVVNVIAGQAKTLLVGTPYHFQLTTPRVETSVPPDDAESLVLAFVSEIGEFTLTARLPV